MRQHLLRTAVAAATCSVLVLGLAPTAHALPTADVVGFYLTDTGEWVPDTNPYAGTTCQPKLHADLYRPAFHDLNMSSTTLSMTETGGGHALVRRWDCGSQAVIGAFRMTDHPLYATTTTSGRTTGWQYEQGVEFTERILDLLVTRTLVRDEPTFTGITFSEAGAWWGKPVGGKMVYYPAGCVAQSFVYTIFAWTGTVEVQPYGPEVPCAQPPLPGTPEIVL